MVCKTCDKKPVITISGVKLCRECFIRYFERKVKRTIRQYELIDNKDEVLVAASGGKDSTVVLYILNKILKQRKQKLEALIIDQDIGNYTKKNISNLTKFCKKEGIKLHILRFRDELGYSLCYIRSVLAEKGTVLKSCAICGIFKRYFLNKFTREEGFDKIVTGHNLDDEAQTVLMNQFKGNFMLSAKLGPMTGAIKSKKFVPRIKPLYFCPEKEVELYSKLMEFPIQYSRCPCSYDAYRKRVGDMLNEFDKKNPGTKHSIINSFLSILPLLKKGIKGEVSYCKKCGEPTSSKVCKACEIIGKLSK